MIQETLVELSDNALKFMAPQRSWQYPRADSYLFYSLKQSPPYNCSAPFWREVRNEVFTQLRTVVNKPTIFYLALVKHTEKSLHLPSGTDTPSNHVYIPLTESGSIISTNNSGDDYKSFYSASRDLGTHAPHLVQNWQERDKRWKKLKKYDPIIVDNKQLIVILPEPDTMYFHVEYRDD